jgi:hypothetical protein
VSSLILNRFQSDEADIRSVPNARGVP